RVRFKPVCPGAAEPHADAPEMRVQVHAEDRAGARVVRECADFFSLQGERGAAVGAGAEPHGRACLEAQTGGALSDVTRFVEQPGVEPQFACRDALQPDAAVEAVAVRSDVEAGKCAPAERPGGTGAAGQAE